MTLALSPISKAFQKSPFDCGNPVLNDYFRFYAFKNDQLSIGKTFVALDETGGVAGYMTLSNAQIDVNELPDEMRLKLPRYPVPAFRIGKLAVDLRFQGTGVGSWLLRSALEKALSISASVGIYLVIVDAIDEKAKKFYLKYGFISIPKDTLKLFLPLETIAAGFSAK